VNRVVRFSGPLLVLTACGCGLVLDVEPRVEDATVDDGAADGAVDGAADALDSGTTDGDADASDADAGPAALCLVWGEFGPGTPIPELAYPNDHWAPSPSRDELEIFIDQHDSEPRTNDLYMTSRPDLGSPFALYAEISELNTPDHEYDAHIDATGLTLWYASGPRDGDIDLWRATRPARGDAFGDAARVSELDAEGSQGSPYLSNDGLTLYFVSNEMGSSDVYGARRARVGAPFGPPVPLDEVNTPSSEGDVTVSTDGLEIIIQSNRPGGVGDRDIWYANRPSTGVPFGPPENLAVLNSARDDVSPELSRDGRTLYFVHDAVTAGSPAADADVYVSTRDCLDSP